MLSPVLLRYLPNSSSISHSSSTPDTTSVRQWWVTPSSRSACLAGEIPRRLLNGDYDGAKEYALTMRDIFGEDSFYLELQDHGIPDQTEVNRQLLRLHNETGIPLVCTNDAHYLRKEDADIQDVLRLDRKRSRTMITCVIRNVCY